MMNSAKLILILLVFSSALHAGKRKVLLIGVDGVRSDILLRLNSPNINFLAQYGFGVYNSWHQDLTVSGPSWSSILCGVYHNKHGVLDNTFKGSQYSSYPILCQLGKQILPNLKFGMYMEWGKFREVNENLGWDQIITGRLGNIKKTTEESCVWIINSDLDFYFVYFGAPDLFGHIFGFSPYNPFYTDAIENVDWSIGALSRALKQRPEYYVEDWLILVTTDHGGLLLKHGGYSIYERQVMWFAYNERISSYCNDGYDMGNLNFGCNPICNKDQRCCPVQPDIAVTALHHLLYEEGFDPAYCDEWKLDGKSWLKEMGLQSDKLGSPMITYNIP